MQQVTNRPAGTKTRDSFPIGYRFGLFVLRFGSAGLVFIAGMGTTLATTTNGKIGMAVSALTFWLIGERAMWLTITAREMVRFHELALAESNRDLDGDSASIT